MLNPMTKYKNIHYINQFKLHINQYSSGNKKQADINLEKAFQKKFVK